MGENIGPPDEVRTEAVTSDESSALQSLIEELKVSPRFQALGLSNDSKQIISSVLCSLWRTLPRNEFDALQGLLPAGLDLLVSSCTRPHGRHTPPDMFSRDAFLEDLSAHLDSSREQAHATASVILPLLRERIPEDDLENAFVFLHADLKHLLLGPA